MELLRSPGTGTPPSAAPTGGQPVVPGLILDPRRLALLGAEMLLPGVYLLWIGLAAVGTGLLVLAAGAGFGVAVLAFLALLALGVLASLRIGRRAAHR
jgi:membrane protein implicated in regulation of membrane protease activity